MSLFNYWLAEFYDELLALVYSLTSKFISERMWNVFPLLYDMFKNDGADYFTGKYKHWIFHYFYSSCLLLELLYLSTT